MRHRVDVGQRRQDVATAPQPSISASPKYVNPGQAVTLTLGTTYTITSSCERATYATPNSAKFWVQVYGGQPLCTPVTESYCMTCPSSLDGEPPWTTTIVQTACSAADARRAAQAMGTNCSLSDGACS